MAVNAISHQRFRVTQVRVTSSGVTAINLLPIDPDMVIARVFCRIQTAAADADANNLTIGDDDDADGYIVASSAKAAAGTVYGDATAEIGAYLTEALTPTVATNLGKIYTAVKNLKFVLSAAPDTEGVYDVIVFWYRLRLTA